MAHSPELIRSARNAPFVVLMCWPRRGLSSQWKLATRRPFRAPSQMKSLGSCLVADSPPVTSSPPDRGRIESPVQSANPETLRKSNSQRPYFARFRVRRFGLGGG
jgi:hypothetical protein